MPNAAAAGSAQPRFLPVFSPLPSEQGQRATSTLGPKERPLHVPSRSGNFEPFRVELDSYSPWT